MDTVVVHFCSNVVADPKSPYRFDAITQTFRSGGVAPHYLIDREGTIFLLVDEARAAYHAGKGRLPWSPHRENTLNDFSIGVELMGIGTAEEMELFIPASRYGDIAVSDLGFTPAQYVALNRLIRDMEKRWPSIRHDRRHIIGHDEYAPGRRTDPGKLFDWSQLGLPATAGGQNE
ncbi:MAG: N-acetylmuramoyl-L-alanine amidase [Verrucomicrobia bacterium]|nr:N-acetylmuramoyl-L-alanine amidase [Verrucomicrobiota bacterium]